MSESAVSRGALAWTSCSGCGGKAFVALAVHGRGLAVACGACGWIAPVRNPARYGISHVDLRRVLGAQRRAVPPEQLVGSDVLLVRPEVASG